MASSSVPNSSSGQTSCSLGATIALKDRCRENDCHEVLDFRLQRSTTRNEDSESSSQDTSYHAENKIIVSVVDISILHVVEYLCLDGSVKDSLDKARLALNILLDLLVNLVVEGRERAKDCWLKILDVGN
jgi:hypothetical protein